MEVARNSFQELGMRKTKLHNGVLFFLAVADRKFVILGDDGINEKVPENFWSDVRDHMSTSFSNLKRESFTG